MFSFGHCPNYLSPTLPLCVEVWPLLDVHLRRFRAVHLRRFRACLQSGLRASVQQYSALPELAWLILPSHHLLRWQDPLKQYIWELIETEILLVLYQTPRIRASSVTEKDTRYGVSPSYGVNRCYGVSPCSGVRPCCGVSPSPSGGPSTRSWAPERP